MNRRDLIQWVSTELIAIMAVHDVPVLRYRLRGGRGEILAAATNLPSDGLARDITDHLAAASDVDIHATVYGTSKVKFRGELKESHVQLKRNGAKFSLDREMEKLWVHRYGEAFVTNSVTGERKLPADIPEGHVVEELDDE